MTATTAHHKTTFAYHSHHSAHHLSHLHHAPQRTTDIAPQRTTQIFHLPQRTTIHPKKHHTPQRTNHTRHTAPHQSSPNPAMPNAPGIAVLITKKR